MANKRRRFSMRHRLQYREAVVSTAVSILSINLLIIWGTLFPQLFSFSIHSSTGYLVIALIEAVVLGVVLYISIQHTRSIAGPVYAISRDLSRLGQGDLLVQVKLREGDAFLEETASINAATEALKNRARHIKGLFAAMQKCTDPSELSRLSDELSVALAALQTEPGEKSPEKTSDGN